jgi:hypothetical protein
VTRILLRAPKDPFEVRRAEQVLEQNLIGNNAGNLVFIDAAHKLLSAPGATVAPDRFRTDPRAADRINDEFDTYVLPLANAFRPSFVQVLDRMTELISRLRIPVVVLGVGAQATLDYDWTRLGPIEPSVKAFVKAVLDHGPSIGVRGELTAEYLRSLGFSDVEVVGCPSLFARGPDLRVERAMPELTPDARIALTVSPYVKAFGPIVTHHLEAYPNLVYIAQDIESLELLLWGGTHPDAWKTTDNPVHLAHPLIRDDRTLFFLDPFPWIEDLRTRDLSFGTRIHGTIAALLAGTPGVVVAHDSRTLELARYFDIPHRTIRDVGPETDAADLYAEADWTALNEGHAARWATFQAYLARHRVDHAFAHDGAAEAWDARAAATAWLPPVRRDPGADGPPGVLVRARRARYAARRAARRANLRRKPAELVRRVTGRAKGRG